MTLFHETEGIVIWSLSKAVWYLLPDNVLYRIWCADSWSSHICSKSQSYIIISFREARLRGREWGVELVQVEGRVLWDIFLGAERRQSQPLTVPQLKLSPLLHLLHNLKPLLQNLLILPNKAQLVLIATLQTITCALMDRTLATSSPHVSFSLSFLKMV